MINTTRHHVLDLPYMVKLPGVKYLRDLKVHLYTGELPENYQQYKPAPFSYNMWIENVLNKREPVKSISSEQFTPFAHQKVAAKKLLDTYRNNQPGFFIADKTGVGKTLSTLTGVVASARTNQYERLNRVLIVCPLRVIPTWVQTIESFKVAQDYCQFMIINYEQLSKLLTTPESAKKAKRVKTKNKLVAKHGKPKFTWDFVIFDESHYLKNYPSSNQSMLAVNVAQLNKPYVKGKTPFTVFSTATPGSDPLNFAVMSKLFAPYISPQGDTVTPETWGEFLASEGFAVTKGKEGYSWVRPNSFDKNSNDPKRAQNYRNEVKTITAKRQRDVQRIGRALKEPSSPFIMRSPEQIDAWPKQRLIPLPLELTLSQKPIYFSAWTRFKDWMKLPGARNDPKGMLVESLRYRQKASYLKAESMVDFIVDTIEEGNQVYCSCFFGDTIERLRELLAKRGIAVSEISGRLSQAEATQNRLDFQKGKTKVVLCSVAEGISLHAGETLPDGTKATTAPRVSIIFDIRGDPNKTVQSLGRAHRSGQNSLTYIPFFRGTIEKKDVDTFIDKYSNMMKMTGDDTSSEELNNTFVEVTSDDYMLEESCRDTIQE